MVFCSKFSKTCFIGPIVNKSENSEIRPEPRQRDTVLPYYIYFHVDNILSSPGIDAKRQMIQRGNLFTKSISWDPPKSGNRDAAWIF